MYYIRKKGENNMKIQIIEPHNVTGMKKKKEKFEKGF